MNTGRDPEAIIGEWLDEGPDSLPPITRQVVLSSIHATPQRGTTAAWPPKLPRGHVPGRYFHMSGFMRVAVASVLAIVVGSTFYGGFWLASTSMAPASAPSASASPGTTEAAPIVYVSGTGTCTDQAGGSTTAMNGLMMTLGATFECTSDTNDPRVDGTWQNTWNNAWSQSKLPSTLPSIWWGTSHLDNADGSWDCTWFLTDFPHSASYPVLRVCRGGGGYDGLTYVAEHVMNGAAETQDLGYIYEGPPPVEFVPPAS